MPTRATYSQTVQTSRPAGRQNVTSPGSEWLHDPTARIRSRYSKSGAIVPITNFGSTLPNTVLQCTDDLGLAQRFYRVRLD